MPSRCIHFGKCGGCCLLDRPYSEQLDIKRAKLEELFGKFRLSIPAVLPCSEQLYYRHKVQLPFSPGKRKNSREVLLGCYGKDSHDVIDQKECLVQDRELSTIAWTIREWASAARMTTYDENTGNGYLRHVLLRKGVSTDEILIGLVTNGGRQEGSRNLSVKLLEMIGNKGIDTRKIAGIIQNVNTRRTNVVLGEREYAWWGRSFLKEKLGSFSFHAGLSTFFQVNPFQTPVLYDQVLKHVPERSRVLDVYCGVGSISLWVSKKASAVVGIEENIVSVKAARAAASANKIHNVTFYAGDAAGEVPFRIKGGVDAVIVDPPRKGLETTVVEHLRNAGIQRLIYVSCNPDSLARDTELLRPALKLISLQGVDMFPQTDHIETVAVFERYL